MTYDLEVVSDPNSLLVHLTTAIRILFKDKPEDEVDKQAASVSPRDFNALMNTLFMQINGGGLDFTKTRGILGMSVCWLPAELIANVKGYSIPHHGWKLHISAKEHSAFDIAKAIIPVFERLNIVFNKRRGILHLE